MRSLRLAFYFSWKRRFALSFAVFNAALYNTTHDRRQHYSLA